ncbi:MAG TPA: TIGR03862 family flavoprotein [Burkholderiaceae bacterium]|nr:TIGR03862 family flavoprotein [Burkholderiaceae bacterium]
MVKHIVIIGAGPAGLMAAQEAVRAVGPGCQVSVYDAMPTAGRKFLLAGKGGLNLTHSESFEPFLSRYGLKSAELRPLLKQFGSDEVQTWAHNLGIETFVGSSGRVFPKDMKAAPLLRVWLHALKKDGVQFYMRHRFLGWSTNKVQNLQQRHQLNFESPDGVKVVLADAVILAMGGGSWARLGSDGKWVDILRMQGVTVNPLLPSNCGFDVLKPWSTYFAERFAGHAFKTVAITVRDESGKQLFSKQGEFVATATGVEGSLIYAASALLRDAISQHGQCIFYLDLCPDRTSEQVLREVGHPRGARSLSSHLKSRLKIDGIKLALLHELLSKEDMQNTVHLAQAIKALPVCLKQARPIDEAISTAGGVAFTELTDQLMLKKPLIGQFDVSGVFLAGEMLDWEAPTGGYLLTACMSTGAMAGRGAARYLT